MTASTLAVLITAGISIFGAFVMLLMVNYLPESPIQSFIARASIFWGYADGLAYFIPVGEIIAVLEVWVSCMAAVVVFKIVYELVNKIIE